MPKQPYSAKRTALTGLMAALTCALSFLESLLPPIAGLPPGAKPGLANVAVMAASGSLGLPSALLLALLKAGFSGITRGATAGFMSLMGGLVSALGTGLLLRCDQCPFGFLGIGVTGALLHNLGQLCAARLLLGSGAVWGYAPFLLLFGLATGIITGTVLKLVLPLLQKHSNRYIT